MKKYSSLLVIMCFFVVTCMAQYSDVKTFKVTIESFAKKPVKDRWEGSVFVRPGQPFTVDSISIGDELYDDMGHSYEIISAVATSNVRATLDILVKTTSTFPIPGGGFIVGQNVDVYQTTLVEGNNEFLPRGVQSRWLNHNTVVFDSLITAVRTIPAGTMTMYAGTTAPVGWKFCDGSLVSRTAYPELFNILGSIYGDGDGTTTFNLPDMRSRLPMAAGSGPGLTNRSLAEIGGVESIQLDSLNMPPHTHNTQVSPIVGKTGMGSVVIDTPDDGYLGISLNNSNIYRSDPNTDGTLMAPMDVDMETSGGNIPFDALPPFMAVNFIIKY